MGVDPTFNLGDFSVTPIVYQHLLLRHRQGGKSPWMLGPTLVHYRKEFRNYKFFFSSLIGLRQSLSSVRAIGTDGEHNLIEAMKHQFREAIFYAAFAISRGISNTICILKACPQQSPWNMSMTYLDGLELMVQDAKDW